MNKKEEKKKPSNKSEALKAFTHFSQIGVTIAASVLVGVLLGRFLDNLFGTTPWLLLIFSLLGVGSAIQSLFNIPKN